MLDHSYLSVVVLSLYDILHGRFHKDNNDERDLNDVYCTRRTIRCLVNHALNDGRRTAPGCLLLLVAIHVYMLLCSQEYYVCTCVACVVVLAYDVARSVG